MRSLSEALFSKKNIKSNLGNYNIDELLDNNINLLAIDPKEEIIIIIDSKNLKSYILKYENHKWRYTEYLEHYKDAFNDILYNFINEEYKFYIIDNSINYKLIDTISDLSNNNLDFEYIFSIISNIIKLKEIKL